MIIKNTSEVEIVSFFIRTTKSEYVTIEPGKYIFIDESIWELSNLKNLIEILQKDCNIEILGDRKNYDIETKPPTKEEFVNRFEIMDIEE